MPQKMGSLLVPLFILLISLFASAYVLELPELAISVLPLLPYILAFIMVFLAWHFNRGKVLLAGGLLLLPVMFPYVTTSSIPSSATLITAIGFGLLLMLKERGFFNRYAFNRMLFLIMLVAWSVFYERGWVNFTFLNMHLPWLGLSFSTLISWLVVLTTIVASTVTWWRHADGFSAAVLVSLVTLLLIELMTFTTQQESSLRSAQMLIWIWFVVAESHRMAYRDELTQLPGRRALNEALVALPKRYAVAMLDIDHFKKFNDSYGHDKGDEVLKLVARVLQQESGPASVYRYGGEEFTVLFKGRVLEQAQTILENLREHIHLQQLNVTVGDKEKMVSVTASIGIATAEEGELPEDVIKRADVALYKAKKKGRNCIVMN